MDHDSERALFLLQTELASRGIKADLDTRPASPRLRVHSSREGTPEIAEFENSIVAACFGHDLWYSWPWCEPIARTSQVDVAADEIVRVLGEDEGIWARSNLRDHPTSVPQARHGRPPLTDPNGDAETASGLDIP